MEGGRERGSERDGGREGGRERKGERWVEPQSEERMQERGRVVYTVQIFYYIIDLSCAAAYCAVSPVV